MHALILFTHPDTGSLTSAIADRISTDLESRGWTTETADLYAEGFDPRYNDADLGVLKGTNGVPDDVRAQQERIERADSIVFVHPVYWWGMPALMKGFLDRVLTFGWAFGGEDATALKGKDIHLVRLGGNAPETYENHGYTTAIRTSVEHGVFDFVSGPVSSSHFIHTAPDELETRVASTVEAVVNGVVESRAEVTV